MSVDLKTLFDRLPAYHRRRDHDEGGQVRGALADAHTLEDAADYGPLKSLLSVMLREGQIVAEDIDQLYDDHFIETASPWLIPYIGALVGASLLEDIGDTQSTRQWVAATIALRQRKGTLAALEAATRAATGWPVVAVEYWSRVATTESLRRVRIVNRDDMEVTADSAWSLRDVPDNPASAVPPFFRNPAGTADLGRISALDRVGTAFDTTHRSAEFGRIEQGAGRWNLPNIGLHMCRLEAVSLGSPRIGEGADGDGEGESPGHLVQPTHVGARMYRFSPFGGDQPLFQRPAVRDADLDRRSDEKDLPIPITRRMLFDRPDLYVGHSFRIRVTTGAGIVEPDPGEIMAANLASRPDGGGDEVWAWPARDDRYLVDPVLGRFVLPANLADVEAVHVYWHFGRAHQIGGHERAPQEVPAHDTTGSVTLASSTAVSISDVPGFRVSGSNRLLEFSGGDPRLVATEGACPSVDLEGRMVRFVAASGADVLISGVRFFNGRVMLTGSDARFRFEDCTLIERASLNDPVPNAAPWFVLRVNAGIAVALERTIVDGNIFMRDDVDLSATDCIVRGRRPESRAIFGGDNDSGQTLTLRRSTVIGRVESFQVSGSGPGDVGGIEVTGQDAGDSGISDSLIVTDPDHPDPGLNITATQEGCVRYSLIPDATRAPRQYKCLPKPATDPQLVRPQFTSTDIRDPGFMQLGRHTPGAILIGGENGSEMGVGNRQLTSARLRNLDRTSREFLRFGYSAGPIYET